MSQDNVDIVRTAFDAGIVATLNPHSTTWIPTDQWPLLLESNEPRVTANS
jgi:hypothetical protein